ncbi:MAG: cobyrinate a,c-diamide synthase, partial [Desulforhabdus sp.]|nr:cobyrinate a,c-diamide synthase [Desulforhabdus sp.]
MIFQKPRLVIAALRGGAGKTVVSLGVAAAWRIKRGLRVVPFKKGPDYIDAGWLSVAAQSPCYNLDPFLMKSDEMLLSFVQRAGEGDVGLIEGNRGLYDGVDVQGSFSTAELAKLLSAPVVLVLDATKMTRTAAALVLGCQQLDPEVRIAGIILNKVAGKRHEKILQGAIEKYCGVPVVGVLPKEGNMFFPERHMGLVPPQEADNAAEAMKWAAARTCECVDLGALWRIAESADTLGWPATAVQTGASVYASKPVTIGIVRDAAFQFYYPENLEALQERGAILQEISSFEDCPLPTVDALYIGGGFPEAHLRILAANSVFRESLRGEIDAGLPVYAECGGLMFLCANILHKGCKFPMTGIFPYDVVLEAKPQGHGYTILECVRENPFFAKGARFKGHEFHYSRVIGCDSSLPFVFRLQKGHGIVAGWDGLCYKNTLASYSHVHAVGNKSWAEAMVHS